MDLLNSQVEYNQFYDKLKRYANQKASRLFSDLGLRADAVDTALDRATDELISNQEIENMEALVRDIVDKSLVSSFIAKKTDSASASPDEKQILGDTGRIQQILDKGKLPKVRILDLPEGKQKRICLLYWRDGLTQKEIATKLGVVHSYISEVIKKYSN